MPESFYKEPVKVLATSLVEVSSSCTSCTFCHDRSRTHGNHRVCSTVSGGALQIGKGIGKGITTGDTSAIVDGFTKGASSVGGGISQGAESAVMGAADGILSAGKGIFSGVKNVGQGIGGAIRGKKPSQFQRKKQEDGNARDSSNRK